MLGRCAMVGRYRSPAGSFHICRKLTSTRSCACMEYQDETTVLNGKVVRPT